MRTFDTSAVTETFTGGATFRKIRTPHGMFIRCSCTWWADGPFESRGEAVASWCVHNAEIHGDGLEGDWLLGELSGDSPHD